MLNFHQLVSELQVAEDNMLDNHKQTIEQLYAAAEKAERILRTTDDVTYDQDGMCYFSSILFYFIHLLFQ